MSSLRDRIRDRMVTLLGGEKRSIVIAFTDDDRIADVSIDGDKITRGEWKRLEFFGAPMGPWPIDGTVGAGLDAGAYAATVDEPIGVAVVGEAP